MLQSVINHNNFKSFINSSIVSVLKKQPDFRVTAPKLLGKFAFFYNCRKTVQGMSDPIKEYHKKRVKSGKSPILFKTNGQEEILVLMRTEDFFDMLSMATNEQRMKIGVDY